MKCFLVPVLAALTILAPACGGSSNRDSATTTSAATGALAFAHCMRSHGVPNFPDPDAQGRFPTFDANVSKQISAAADRTCKSLLPGGGTGTPAQRQQKLAFALAVARCLRRHGYPNFPDPSTSGQGLAGAKVDTDSPQFQAKETSCEQQARKALGLP